MKLRESIRSKADIFSFFQLASVPKNELLIGMEVERSGVFDKDLSPVQYLGQSGYLAIAKKLVEEVGWKIFKKDDVGNILALKRGESELHIESDGRLELVSKPRKGLFALCREYKMHTREIDEISKEFGVRWISMGRQPFARRKDINAAFPKKVQKEYTHYRKYFPDWQENIFSAWSKKNNSIHINFGYTSEKNAVEKFQTLAQISPILMAMFANSPLNSGKFSGYLNYRAHTSAQACPHRTSMQKQFFEDNFSFEKWIDYLLNIPMRRIERDGKAIHIPLVFGEFLKNGFNQHHARMEDFYLHIKSVWNEIRIKHYLEYRGLDTVPPKIIPSVPAVIHALTLNSSVMSACKDLVTSWTFSDQLVVRENIYKHALQAEIPGGGTILPLAKELLEIASYSLKEHQRKKNERVDASRFLWPIKEYVFVREQSPAEYVMEMWNGKWHKNQRKLLEWSEQ